MKKYLSPFPIKIVIPLIIMLCFSIAVNALDHSYQTDKKEKQVECESFFVFSRSRHDCQQVPRGGTSKGPATVLDPEPSADWLAIQEKGLSQFERDRRAILAMAGPYRTSFDFLETVGFTKKFSPDRPYQSWGTEYVYVAEESENFISLQHIMVMFFEDEAGTIQGPLVMKHWRQDWQYEKPELWVYVGNNIWKKQAIVDDKTGTWTQSVYQVDDSPRYESYGRWQHRDSFSTWVSATTMRPLPRREYSVRKDYHVLEGINRHTITPNGWVHEQENYKVATAEKDDGLKTRHYLSKEIGLNRYERIIDHDFTAGDAYWQATQGFWQEVIAFWKREKQASSTISLHKRVNGVPMFVPLFEYASQLENKPYNKFEAKAFIEKTIQPYIAK